MGVSNLINEEKMKPISEGVIDIGFMKIRVYVMADGERFINADDLEQLFMGDNEFDPEKADKLARGINGKLENERKWGEND